MKTRSVLVCYHQINPITEEGRDYTITLEIDFLITSKEGVKNLKAKIVELTKCLWAEGISIKGWSFFEENPPCVASEQLGHGYNPETDDVDYIREILAPTG